MSRRTIACFLMTLLAAAAAHAQSKWASADDATAKVMIDAERQWAEAACNHNQIAQTILADDFQGTSTEGKRYSKPQEVADTADTSNSATDCRLLDTRVRFFGENVALIYGSESSVRKAKDGKEARRCQIWTDTWLKRNGKWQIVAAQDALIPCK